MLLLLRVFLVTLVIFGSTQIRPVIVKAHNESGEWSCESDDETRVFAEFRPGVITLDGHADDWNDVEGFDFSLLPALDPDADREYKGGKMTVKALHDGKDVSFLLQVDGDYVYSKGLSQWKCQMEFSSLSGRPLRVVFITRHYRTLSQVLSNVGEETLSLPGVGLFINPQGHIFVKAQDPQSFCQIRPHCMFGLVTSVRKDNSKCPSVALMFQIGDSATYHNMGGCKESTSTCDSKSCRGYEVDIMHFSVGNAIPGRLYGGNPIDNREGNGGDRFGHLVDLYAWNPHCRNLDGVSSSGNDSSAQNNWKGAWWHSSLTTHTGFIEEDSPYSTSGQKGTYYFEFSRPLRTMDRLQQDVQFTIGQPSKFSAAFWYPVDGNPWHGSGHYSVSCDWVPIDISAGTSSQAKATSNSSWDAASAFALVLSAVSIGMSVFVGYLVKRTNTVPFTPMDRL